MWISLLLCLGFYDAGVPLILIIPLILIVWENKLSRRIITLSVLWYLSPLIYLVGSLIIIFQGHQVYEAMVFSQNYWAIRMILGLIHAYQLNLMMCWINILSAINFSNIYVYFAFGFGILFGVFMLIYPRPDNMTNEIIGINLKTYSALILLGLVTIGGGFIAYSITQFYNETYRVFMFSSAGSAIIIAAGCAQLSKLIKSKQKIIFAALGTIFISLSMVFAFSQQQVFVDDSTAATKVLKDVIFQIPRLKKEANLIILNAPEPQSLQFSTFLHHGYLINAFEYMAWFKLD